MNSTYLFINFPDAKLQRSRDRKHRAKHLRKHSREIHIAFGTKDSFSMKESRGEPPKTVTFTAGIFINVSEIKERIDSKLESLDLMDFYRRHEIIKNFYPDLAAVTINSWARAGLFTPLQPGEAQGAWAKYSYQNLIELGVIRQLSAFNMSMDFMLTVMEILDMENAIKFL